MGRQFLDNALTWFTTWDYSPRSRNSPSSELRRSIEGGLQISADKCVSLSVGLEMSKFQGFIDADMLKYEVRKHILGILSFLHEEELSALLCYKSFKK